MATKYSTILTDLYTNNKLIAPQKDTLSGVFIGEAEADVAAADNDGDIYRLFRVPGNAIPTLLSYKNDGITGGTDYDFGLYAAGSSGAVKDKDVLLDGINVATAGNTTQYSVPLLIADKGKEFWELAGDSEYTGQEYDVCITANTVGSAAGKVWVTLFCKFTGN